MTPGGDPPGAGSGRDGLGAVQDLRGVAPDALPLVLAHLHARLAVDAEARVLLGGLDPVLRADLVTGAGFAALDRHRADGATVLRRLRTLADTVGPGMRLLVCGLNPSLYAADAGTGFARPSNRFWPALLAAGLAARPRDPLDALASHGVGMTDLVKRATVAADELDRDEYRLGLARVERLVRWLHPGAVCFVGLAGWRAAVDRRATAGWQAGGLGGRPAYLMPSTSGLNAHSRPAQLAEHLRAAAAPG